MKKRCVPLTCTLMRTFSSGLRPLMSLASPKYGLPCSWMSAGSKSASPANAVSIRTVEKPAIRKPCCIIFDIGVAPPDSIESSDQRRKKLRKKYTKASMTASGTAHPSQTGGCQRRVSGKANRLIADAARNEVASQPYQCIGGPDLEGRVSHSHSLMRG